MCKTSRRQRRMEASAEGDRGLEGAVAPQMDWVVKRHVACKMTKMISGEERDMSSNQKKFVIKKTTIS